MQGWRALELFAGIGGFACAARSTMPDVHIVRAIDVDRDAMQWYRRHWSNDYGIATLESISLENLQQQQSNFWWLSPPCQPYSRRGNRKDADDPRSAALLHLIRQIPYALPEIIALENVVEFQSSQCAELLRSTLEKYGYNYQSLTLCPTEMGWPNRRNRFYLIAARRPLKEWSPLPQYNVDWRDWLSPIAEVPEECWLPAKLNKYVSGMHRVATDDRDAITACFGSSYGKSILHAGSYVEDSRTSKQRLRWFTPSEVARCLGYPVTTNIQGVPLRTAWRLLGNGLSIPAMQYVLAHVPL